MKFKTFFRRRDSFYKILDSISSVAVLPFAMYGLFEEAADPHKLRLYCAAFFFAFGLSYVFQVLRKRCSFEPYLWQLIQMAIYLLSVVLILAIPNTDVSTPIITVLFTVMLIAVRIRSIVKNHSYRNVFYNGSCILLVVAALIYGSFTFVCLYMLAVDLVHIVSLSFSGMDIQILMRVIRKTYALDVLSGLVLFIGAFSFVFPVLEEGIPTYKDALWYCFAIVTTIGFGDFSAMTHLGRIMSVILGVYGIVVVALITSVVVNFYSEVRALPDEEEDGNDDKSTVL